MSQAVRQSMDRMYRHQRHVYDLTRKYYLLGRDRLIDEVRPRAGETVCEVGCGTARNLVALARRYPDACVMGLDASDAMLDTAKRSLERSGLSDRVAVAQAFAQTFTPATFGRATPFDHVLFSYTLSMIPGPQAALDNALAQLRPGGTLRVVDFGDQAGLPGWFRTLLVRWLALFHVEHRPEVAAWFEARAAEGAGLFAKRTMGGGYAEFFTLTKG
ncbi:class I SAM-dependent methyltransferase [Marinivivus vitaminiproducens]|uniref:class I SAM-dependent methyltransferase n=1 Tax=Marinivivus vitaminiproducens TaxID=3035935 RepID=UPI0027A8C521|nr:class I SAM-dependent methyltransferase [Geminicoccaceae bacterium SCSIO 64248]